MNILSQVERTRPTEQFPQQEKEGWKLGLSENSYQFYLWDQTEPTRCETKHPTHNHINYVAKL